MITFSELGNMGRLGNQLFQIASTIGIAKKNNTEYYFPDWIYSKLFRADLPILDTKVNTLRYTETKFCYQDVVLDVNYNWDLYGYFQSEKYFGHCSGMIKDYFRFKEEIKTSVLNTYSDVLSRENVSVHIRRGDYLLKPEYHINLPIEWYNKALSYFPKGITKVVFSDDIPWCRENLTWENVVYPNGSESEDLVLMSVCRNNIIANSSFSWWGAWLNENGCKKVIGPANWFGPAAKADTKDIVPHLWLLI